MHVAGVDEAPAIPKTVRVVTFDVKALGRVVLEDGDGIVAALEEKLDRFRAEQRGIKTVEENRAPAPLGVADLPGEDGLTGGLPSSVELKILIADHLDELRAEGFGGPSQLHIAGGVGGLAFRAEFAAFLVDDAFAADDDHVLLKIVGVLHARDEVFEIERVFGHENDVGTAVS